MNEVIKFFDNASKLVKLILALPGLDIFWVVYRICKSLDKGNNLGLILGIVLLIVGIPFLWLLDIIMILLDKPVLWLD
jgi:hypothetical protein